MTLGNGLHRHETDVVAIADVTFARIAEADEKQHGVAASVSRENEAA